MKARGLSLSLLSGSLLMAFLVVLFTNTTGFLGDEGAYIQWSHTTPVGDFFIHGKNPIFYSVNFFLRHLFGNWIPINSFLIPQIFYLVAYSILFTFFILTLCQGVLEAIVLWLLVVFNPLSIIHVSHLTMENLALLLLTGIFLATLKSRKTPAWYYIIGLLSYIVTLHKMTSFPAVALHAILVARMDRTKALVIGVSGVLAILSQFMLFTILKPEVTPFWITDAHTLTSLHYLKDNFTVFLSEWAPFNFVTLIACLCFFIRRIFGFADRSTLIDITMLTGLSGVLSFGLFAIMSLKFNINYQFPLYWMSFLWTCFYVRQNIKVLAFAVPFFLVLFTTSLTPGINQYRYWSPYFREVFFQSPPVVFSKIMFFRLNQLFGPTEQPTCVLINQKDGDYNYYYQRAMVGVFPLLNFFWDDPEAFSKCTGRKIFIDRRYANTNEECHLSCPDPKMIRVCTSQKITNFSAYQYDFQNPGLLRSIYCFEEKK